LRGGHPENNVFEPDLEEAFDMTDDAQENDLDKQDGEVLPSRELMSLISTDPTDGFAPVLEQRPPGETLPVEPRDTA